MNNVQGEIVDAVDRTVSDAVHNVVSQTVDGHALVLVTIIRDIRSVVQREVKLVMDELPS